MLRKEELVSNEIYHIYNSSIAEFKIFHYDADLIRMQQILQFYRFKSMPTKFSIFAKEMHVNQYGFSNYLSCVSKGKEEIVQLVCYCIMPTHFHLILKQLKNGGISNFVSNVQNSYSHYFNIKLKRKGPLWEGRFKNVLVKTDQQLLHLTRYIHLNPVTAKLVDWPQDWYFSSYAEYLQQNTGQECLCEFKDLLKVEPDEYARFVKNRISYQRELAKIKRLLLE